MKRLKSHYQLMKELKGMSKKNLIIYFREENRKVKNQNSRLVTDIINKTNQIRHFRIRVKKIRNSLDYLLQHPFSNR